MVKRLALLGHNVRFSKSEEMHAFLLSHFGYQIEYCLLSVSKEEFSSAVEKLSDTFDGYNITTPYKEEVLPYLREVEKKARSCRSVNTVCCGVGYTTDGDGFVLSMRNKLNLRGARVLILGAGGAGRSVALALKNVGADVYLYRRDEEKLRIGCEALGVKNARIEEENGEESPFDLIVNATGVGSVGTEGKLPLFPLPNANYFYDLSYVPTETEFLKEAKRRGKQTQNGEEMLFCQAYLSDCIYLNKTPSEKECSSLWEAYQTKRKE